MAKILVVDDQETIRLAIKLYLDDEYPDVVEAVDASSALRLASVTRPDCIIMDWVLPDGDGIVTARRIRATIKGLEHVPVIICTARRVLPDQRQAFVKEFGGFLGKPFKREELLILIKQLLTPPESPTH